VGGIGEILRNWLKSYLFTLGAFYITCTYKFTIIIIDKTDQLNMIIHEIRFIVHFYTIHMYVYGQ